MQLAIESDTTVQHYIETLLLESPRQQQLPGGATSAAAAAQRATEQPVSSPVEPIPIAPTPMTPIVSPNNTLPATKAPPATAVPLDRSEAFVKHLQIAQASTAQRLTGRVSRPAALAQAPGWVESETLTCLTFKIANLKLALPLQYLSGVQPFPAADELAPCRVAELSSWQDSFLDCCLGQIDQRVVIDTARLVMPERYAPAMAENYRQILQIRDMDWCFAVDSIGGELDFRASEVRWRSQHTRREWLAGTVIDKMCAIVDVDALHRLLLAASVLGDASEQREP